MRFLPYEPDQAWLLPPSVKDVLGEGHLCFFLHQVVERLDLSAFQILRIRRAVSLPPGKRVKRKPVCAAELFQRCLRARHAALPRRQHDAPMRGSEDGRVRSRAVLRRCVYFWGHSSIITHCRPKRSFSTFASATASDKAVAQFS